MYKIVHSWARWRNPGRRCRGESLRVSLDEKPYEIVDNGKKAYLDEQDVVTFLDPPKELIPLDPSYNPAACLW